MLNISIIIPLYNKAGAVARSIQSVLSQSYKDFELIVVNDGSNDNSMEVVRNFEDDRIICVEQENGGPGKARNTGVEHSHGNWIFFLDADDELTDGALGHLWNMTKLYPQANIIDGSFIIRNGEHKKTVLFDNKIIKNNYKAFFFNKIKPSAGHSLFKKDLIDNYPFNTNIRRYEDFELIMRILKNAQIVTTSKPIYYYDTSFGEASIARETIDEDFIGHLDFNNTTFWEYMCLYKLYLWERDYYPEAMKRLYPGLHRRYDLLFLYKILQFLK